MTALAWFGASVTTIALSAGVVVAFAGTTGNTPRMVRAAFIAAVAWGATTGVLAVAAPELALIPATVAAAYIAAGAGIHRWDPAPNPHPAAITDADTAAQVVLAG